MKWYLIFCVIAIPLGWAESFREYCSIGKVVTEVEYLEETATSACMVKYQGKVLWTYYVDFEACRNAYAEFILSLEARGLDCMVSGGGSEIDIE